AEDARRPGVPPAERAPDVVPKENVRPFHEGGGKPPVADRCHLGGETPCERLTRLGRTHRPSGSRPGFSDQASRAAATWRCQAAKRSSRSAAEAIGSEGAAGGHAARGACGCAPSCGGERRRSRR